ncbi:hypothetical protein [Streptomyces monashensis]|uniref:Uncharacterized protein n=1 Tax=Streptomyces monashensis TaxID=1678012 RepID=A0A1S2Q289_9ACTN|nr:hypothetical protein [Streptomyces monashensis]OIJ99866.1 hypothetical protein BIV23_27990 [Streptomyces monashensis]
MSALDRRAARAAVVAAVGISALGLSAVTASAKVSYDFKVSPHTVKVGARVHVKGDAENDSDVLQKFCVQQRQGKGPWRTVKCAHGGIGRGGAVDTWVQAKHRGTLQFRGALYEADFGSNKLRLQMVGPAETVRVR